MDTHFDYNHHIAFISTYTKVGTLYMKRHHYHANGIYYYQTWCMIFVWYDHVINECRYLQTYLMD